jgi:DNA-binding protein HU-beta
MNKGELVSSIAKVTGLPKTKVNEVLSAMEDSIVKALKKGEKVALAGFGIYSVVKRKARKGINPKTREEIKIPAKKVPTFKPAKSLKEKIK